MDVRYLPQKIGHSYSILLWDFMTVLISIRSYYSRSVEWGDGGQVDLEVEGFRGLRVLDSQMEREIYGKDQAEVPEELRRLFIRGPPQLVVQPRSEADMAAVLRYAYSRGLPIVPRGAASPPYGGAVPARGGIVLDLSLMRTILALDREAGVVTVECGVRWSDLDEFLKLNGGRFAELLDEDW